MSEMVEAFGIPEFFYTTIGKTETAGGGCVRLYCCIERGGNMVPQFTVVMPALSLLTAAKIAEQAAVDVFNDERIASALHH